jgi:predicted Zn-dependent protease
MYKAGYDPNAYVTFFERIQADEMRRPGTIPKLFSTHPRPPNASNMRRRKLRQSCRIGRNTSSRLRSLTM